MGIQYVWFIWSFILLIVWALIYFSLKERQSKKEMLYVSLFTSFLGLTEPIFVPAYWNPPSIFNLAQNTGFDIESIIFSFAVGGIAVIIYESFFKVEHRQMSQKEMHSKKHKYHLLALSSAPLIFILLYIFAPLNPIYSTIMALLGGGIATWYCRPDLKKKMIFSGLIFLVIYFVFFLSLVLLFPGYVEKVWNLSAISGILILGIPLEELLFAFSLGFLWSSVYEHVKWKRVNRTG